MNIFKFLSPAYRERREKVLRSRRINPHRRRFYRLVNEFTQMESMLSFKPLPNNAGTTIQFFRYKPQAQ